MRCLLLFAAQVAANAWYDSMPVIFWGNISPNKQTASVVVPIKGCLKQTTQVTLQLVGPCSGSTNQAVLIGGNITSGNLAQGIVLTVNDCKDIFTNPSPQDRVYYAAQTDLACQPTACAGGVTPVTCKLAQVCPAKAKWPRDCAAATKCDMNVCGGCSPIFLNDAGSQVCSTCPDLATPSVCKANPCDSSPKTSLQCPQAASASFCLPVTCGGCKAQWYDTYGRPVCASPSCSTIGENFGKGTASLGFALTNGQCKAVKGKKSPVALFKDANQCTINCVCVDNGFVDFGNCNQNLGFTVVNGACQSVQGCPERKTSLKSTFFDSLAACTAACPNLSTPSFAGGSSFPGGASFAGGSSGGFARLPAGAAVASTSSVVCPPGVVAQQCDNPCSTARLPLCAEARGQDLRCMANYCGTCSATWMLNGRPFSCPPSQPCVGQNCCVNSGQAPRDCSAFPCDIRTCSGAATCSPDTCRQCAPTFRDAQGNEIPASMCSGNSNPDAFIRCGAGNPNCCKSGFRPLVCLPPAGMLNSTCAKVDCGNSLSAAGRTCAADPCNACSLEVLNAQNVVITEQCQMIPPTNVCTRVQCPPMLTPNCTARPPSCAGQNLVCIKDQCACQWRWYSVDVRSPSSDCAAALQTCYPSSVCPDNYACEDIPANMRDQLSPVVAAQLTCTQDSCSCRPVLTPPVYGLRQPCKAGDTNCCPDGLLKAQCPVQQVQWTCSRVVCADGLTPDKCRADGCNKCQLQILDKSQNVIPQGKCHLKLDTEMQSICAKVQCPSTTPACSPRPSCYPADWNLVCIHDPCSCRSLWVDQDLRPGISAQCSAQLVTDCVTPDQCPQKFECNDITPQIAAKLSPQVRASLVCIQESCTCRPVSTPPNALPPGFRLPCSGGSCCADGRGPLVCPADLAAATCASVQCISTKISSCVADGCNNCAIKVLGPYGGPVAPGQCRLPLNVSSICPGTVCPPSNGPPNCGPRPSACPIDWTLRCIRDPCVCTRNIWVDEDLRIADAACTAAIQPPCATICPTNFSCPGLVSPFRCIQERCTCRSIIDPLSIPLGGTVAPTAGPYSSSQEPQQSGGKAGKGKASG